VKPREPVPPGARLARRSTHGAARPAGAVARRAEPTALAEPAPRELAGDRRAASKIDLAQMRPEAVALAPRARSSGFWARPASSAPVVPVSAAWTLSPESPRWYGVALPPASPSLGVPSGVGVMAQLDVAKALQRL
jgi:hypothetical protein